MYEVGFTNNTNSDALETWHRRLGHLNLKDICEMSRNGVIAAMEEL